MHYAIWKLKYNTNQILSTSDTRNNNILFLHVKFDVKIFDVSKSST